jgi:hypothetical protein
MLHDDYNTNDYNDDDDDDVDGCVLGFGWIGLVSVGVVGVSKYCNGVYSRDLIHDTEVLCEVEDPIPGHSWEDLLVLALEISCLYSCPQYLS